MRTTSFVSFSQKYASAMAGRNIPVHFGGTDAWTDNRKIQLPALPIGTLMTPWETKVLTGYLDHEVGHLKETDWQVVKPRPDRSDPEYQKKILIHYLDNIFEDVRMENRVIEGTPPIKNYLDAVEQQLQYEKRKRTNAPTAGSAVLEAIYHEAYFEYRKPDINWEPGSTLDQFPQLAPIRTAMKVLKHMRTTAQARELAERVYNLLPKDLDYNVPPPQQGMTLVLDGGQGETLFITASEVEEALKETNKPEALQALLKEIKDGNNPVRILPVQEQKWGAYILPPVDTSQDKIFVPSQKSRTQAEAVKAGVLDEIKAAKRMLNIALRARTKKAWERGLPEGTLDEDDLANLFSGNVNVFKQRRNTHLVDTAVQMMVDLSGSMRRDPTQQAAIITAEALVGIKGIKLSIAGFTAVGHDLGGMRGCGAGRNQPIHIPLFKDFDEAYPSAFERLGAMKTTGGTPLGDAFALGLERLVPRKEPRKVLWVITDGDPQITVADGNHNEFMLMERTYARCQEMNIKVILLNIGTGIKKRTMNCADVALAVSDHSELPMALLTVIKGISL